MSESGKPFTVTDRRSFTADGRRREGAEPAESPAPARREPARGPVERDRASAGVGAAPADFAQFVLSLGAQAGILLADDPQLPEGMTAGDALEGARSIISILEMLRDKTEGRRTAAESEILEGLLFDLRMGYVERARAGGS
jgi:hypothetical protein